MASTPDTHSDEYQHESADVRPNKRQRSTEGDNDANENADNAATKAKRIACIICRKRKLKCDGNKPSCSTCSRLGHNCAYDEVRRKSGPKRGYVKALEERLKQVETLLKTQDPVDKSSEAPARSFVVPGASNPAVTRHMQMNNLPNNAGLNVTNPSIGFTESDVEMRNRWGIPPASQEPPMEDVTFNTSLDMGLTMDEVNYSWEMIGLGLDEPLPPQETIDDLHQIYFEKVHPSVPMIHKYRYLAAMNLAPSQRPPVCLRYAMWTLACSITEKYCDLKEHFYQRARKYVEQDYLKGFGEHMISVAHAQTHILLATYEFKMMFFPRAWMSTGQGVRLCQMMGLHRLDGDGLDVKQCLPPPRDWTEREERRRTFWMAFCEDRYASIGTGWPMTIDEADILNNLPASEEAFERSKPEDTQSLADSLCPSGAESLSSFAGVVLMACLFGRNLVHLHRPDADDKDNDLNGEFWKRHRQMDNILLNTSLSLPTHLKLPNGLSNPNIVFTNMNIHTSTICLHQAAIYKADKNRLPPVVSKESKLRCIAAANEIAGIMRMISHLDLSAMNPFISFCLYVAARVFVQYLKSRPEDDSTADSLKFLLTAMNAMKSKNPLTESFLVQLEVDLQSLGVKNAKYKYFTQKSRSANGKVPTQSGGALANMQGEGGHVDQCNFVKLVDSAHKNANAAGNSPSAPPNFGMQETTSASGNLVNMTASNNNVFNTTDFSSDLEWMRSSNFATNVHPAMHGIFPDIPHTDGGMSSFGRSDTTSNSATIDYSEQGTSDRPTPASSTPSDARSNLSSIQRGSLSDPSSYETSPAAGNGNANVNGGHVTGSNSNNSDQGNDRRLWGGGDIDYGNNEATAMTPGFSLPETPGRDFGQTPGGWEMSNQGLTPVGEGVFRELMGMGTDLMGWDGSS